MPRAVVCGRSSPPAAASSSTSSRIARYSSGPDVALRETERHRPPGAPVDLGHPVHLGARAFVVGARPLEPRRDLEHALAVPAEHVGDREQLVVRRPTCPARDGRRGRGAAACATSRSRARPRPSPRRRARVIARDVVVGRGRLVEAALAHRVVAHRAVADHAADVDALRACGRSRRGTRRRSPSPTPAPRGCSRRGCPRPTPSARRASARSPGAHGRERDAAVAEHDRRDAVPARRGRVGIPRELRVEVRVDVDEAGRDERAVGVDRAACRVGRPRRPRRCGRRRSRRRR